MDFYDVLFARYLGESGGIEPPSGTISITENGEYDVSAYANASVNVSNPDCYTIEQIATRQFGEYIGSDEPIAISPSAFYSCSSLIGAVFFNATNIGNAAFAACQNLTTVVATNAKLIDRRVFDGCRKLVDLDIKNCETIYTDSFKNCSSLVSVRMDKIKSISETSFSGCSKLEELHLENVEEVPTITATSFNGTKLSTTGKIYVPSALYNDFLTAPNWNNFSSNIVPV